MTHAPRKVGTRLRVLDLYGRRLRCKPGIREAAGHAAADVASVNPALAQEVRDQRRRIRERDRFDQSAPRRYCMNWRSR